MWARWTTISRRVFYSPFSRRNSMRIALVFFGQPCFFLRFLYYYYSLRSQAFDRWRFLPQVRWFDFRLGVLQSCLAHSDLIGVYRNCWSIPVFYVVILISSGATTPPPRLHLPDYPRSYLRLFRHLGLFLTSFCRLVWISASFVRFDYR